MKRLSKGVTGLASALTAAAAYTACAVAYALWPAATLGFFNAWFHGLDLALLVPAGEKGWTLGVFVYGLAGVTLAGFFIGVIYAAAHDLVARSIDALATRRRGPIGV